MLRLTKAQKQRFNFRPNQLGAWVADCPVCKEVFQASQITVSQMAVFYVVLDHLESAHGESE